MTGVSQGESVTLDLLKKKMDEFAKERNWERFHSPRNLLLALVWLLHVSTLIPFMGFSPFSVYVVFAYLPWCPGGGREVDDTHSRHYCFFLKFCKGWIFIFYFWRFDQWIQPKASCINRIWLVGYQIEFASGLMPFPFSWFSINLLKPQVRV